MGRPLRITYAGAHYHITARGNERKDIFRSHRDRKQFLSYLESSVNRYGAVVHAYCLMNNHYHLLLETPDGNLSEIMRHINGAYTNYYNTKHSRAGHLFQGRYKALLIEADEYLMELSRYIHLNPVRSGIVENPEEYTWSSYLDYVGKRQAPCWLRLNRVRERFGASGNYRQFVEDMLGKEYENPLRGTVASTMLGRESYVRKIMETHLDGKPVARDVPAIRKLSKTRRIEMIAEHAIGVFGDTGLEQKAGIYLAHRYSGARLKEIGVYFDMKESAISQASRRFAAEMAVDGEVAKVVASLVEKLKLS